MKASASISLFLIGSVAVLYGFNSCLEQHDSAAPEEVSVGQPPVESAQFESPNIDVERPDGPSTQPSARPAPYTPPVRRTSPIAPSPVNNHSTWHLFSSGTSVTRNSNSGPSRTSSLFSTHISSGSSSSSHSTGSSSISHGTVRGGFGSTGHASGS